MAIDGQPAEPFPARDGRLVLAPGTPLDAILDATLPPASRAQIMLHDGTAPKADRDLALFSRRAGARRAAAAARCPARQRPAGANPASERTAVRRLRIGARRTQTGWRPNACTTQVAPAFRARRGRSVVLALTNRAATPVTFHMHGHHFRLLDRLDDGWKPFWLDTLLFDAGQTQRIAFLAEHPATG